MVGVGVVAYHRIKYLGGGNLAVSVLQCQGLVAYVLNGSRLVHGNVSRVRAEHALVGLQHGGDHGGVCLGAAFQEVHVGVGDAKGFLYAPRRLLAVVVLPVAGVLLKVGLLNDLEKVGMGSL